MVQDVGAGQEACGFRQTATVSAGATCQGVVQLAIPILPRSGKPRTKRPIDKEEFGRRGKKYDATSSPALIHVCTGAYGLAGCLLLRRQAAQAAKKAASEAFKTDPLLTDPDVPVNRPMKKKSEMGERAPEGLQVRRSLPAPQSQGGRGAFVAAGGSQQYEAQRQGKGHARNREKAPAGRAKNTQQNFQRNGPLRAASSRVTARRPKSMRACARVQVDELIAKKKQGEKLDVYQLEKISRKGELEAELAQLQR
jgi:hypothetical protein